MEIKQEKPHQWIDITKRLNQNTICWPGEPLFRSSSRTDGDCTVSEFHCGCHCGTHIDAPRHFIPNGKLVSDIDINQFIGECQVIEVDDCCIKPEHLKELKSNKVLFKTQKTEQVHFVEDYCYITPEAALKLAEMNVDLVGIDCMSVEKFGSSDFETHKILLAKNVVVVENLNIFNVRPGFYTLVVLPLNIETEASPVRVVIRGI